MQAEDMAAEYAAKLTMLHEESAARAEGDLRKKQRRYAMLADLQSQAQVCLVHLVCAGVASCSQFALLDQYVAGLRLSETYCKRWNLIKRLFDSFRLSCNDLCIAASSCVRGSCAPISACQLGVLCTAEQRGTAVILLPAMWVAQKAHRLLLFFVSADVKATFSQ